MQIKLIQTEIEEAIRNYIQEQVTVKEGMRINITLSATRGDEGFIANIEIAKHDNEPTTGHQTGGGEARTTAPAGSSGKAEVVQPVAEEAPPAPKTARRTAAPKADPVVAAKPEPELVPAEADEAPAEEEGAQAAADAAPAPGKSLFGGLKSPSNA